MATLLTLVDTGKLVKIDPGLPSDVQEERMILASPRHVEWLRDVLPGLESTWERDRTPQEQLAILFEDFSSGEPLTFGHSFKKLYPRGKGVWELKTADTRLFGWFPGKDVFIGVAGNTADAVKLHGLYPGYVGAVVRFRDSLNLDEPKFIAGDDPHDVVSNYDLP